MELDAKQSALDDWKWETTHWADKALILIPCISWTPRGDTKEPGLPNKICCKDDEEIQQCVRWLRTHREKIKFERKLTQMLCNVNHQSILHWRWWLWPWDEVCNNWLLDDQHLLMLLQFHVNNVVVCWWRFWWMRKMKILRMKWQANDFPHTCFLLAASFSLIWQGQGLGNCKWSVDSRILWFRICWGKSIEFLC